MQKERPVVWLQLGDQTKQVELVMPVSLVIGDLKSNDMLCGMGGSKKNTQRMLPACVVDSKNADNPAYDCRYMPMATLLAAVQELIGSDGRWKIPSKRNKEVDVYMTKALDLLEQMKAHRVNNAFSDVCFGGDPRGILGACAVDPMHILEEGIIKYVLLILMATFTNVPRKELDDIVDDIFVKQKSTAAPDFPRVNFAKGFTNLTLLSCSEVVGIAFTFLLLARLDRGVKVMLKHMPYGSCDDGEFGLYDNPEDDPVLPEYGGCNDGYWTPPAVEDDEDDDEEEEVEMVEYCENPQEANPNEAEEVVITNEDHGDDVHGGVCDGSDDEEEEEEVDDPPTVLGEEAEVDGSGEKKKKKNNKERPAEGMTLMRLVRILEALLAFHAWVKRGHPYEWSDALKEEYGLRVRNLMRMLKAITPRENGNGWQLQKFHSLLHFVDDIDRFGACANYDAGIGEKGLQDWAKDDAQNAVKGTEARFLVSTGRRRDGKAVIHKACRINDLEIGAVGKNKKGSSQTMDPSTLGRDHQPAAEFIGRTKFVIRVKKNPRNARTRMVEWSWSASRTLGLSSLQVHPSIINYFQLDWAKDTKKITGKDVADSVVIKGFTEC